jgi:hypothetical protein
VPRVGCPTQALEDHFRACGKAAQPAPRVPKAFGKREDAFSTGTRRPGVERNDLPLGTAEAHRNTGPSVREQVVDDEHSDRRIVDGIAELTDEQHGGFVYDSFEEVESILSSPYPESMRERGFEQANKSDVFVHQQILSDLWTPAGSQGNDSDVARQGQRQETATEWGKGGPNPRSAIAPPGSRAKFGVSFLSGRPS